MEYNSSIGGEVTLNCSVCVHPKPEKGITITWKYNNTDLPSGVKARNDVLYIPELTDEHIGDYTCHVKGYPMFYTLVVSKEGELYYSRSKYNARY